MEDDEEDQSSTIAEIKRCLKKIAKKESQLDKLCKKVIAIKVRKIK